MRDIVEELRSAIANQQVDVNAIAEVVADLLPRTLSFNNINDDGYVSGNVLAWWVADEPVVFKAVGHSHYAGKDGSLTPDLSTLTTALKITNKISVRIVE